MEHTIIISVAEYRELTAKAERIAAVGRMVESGEYISTGEVMAVLGIAQERGGEVKC